MKTSTLFGLGAIVLVLQATGHTLGGVIFYRAHTPAEADVIHAMQASRVAVEGVIRSLWDFYYGWGLAVGVLNYVLAGVAWATGRLSRQPGGEIGLLTLLLVAGSLGQTLLCLRYFFALPVILTLLGAILCGTGWFVHHRQRPRRGPLESGGPQAVAG
jgi:hypothetical protein